MQPARRSLGRLVPAEALRLRGEGEAPSASIGQPIKRNRWWTGRSPLQASQSSRLAVLILLAIAWDAHRAEEHTKISTEGIDIILA